MSDVLQSMFSDLRVAIALENFSKAAHLEEAIKLYLQATQNELEAKPSTASDNIVLIKTDGEIRRAMLRQKAFDERTMKQLEEETTS